MTVSRPTAATPRLRVTSATLVIPLSGKRVALLKGTNPTIKRIIDDPTGAMGAFLRLLDGARPWPKVVAALEAEYPEVGESELEELRALLERDGLVEDAAAELEHPLAPGELDRYSRNLGCWTLIDTGGHSKHEAQQRLRTATVLVLGVGGIGSNVALGLAMLGVGKLVLVDFDTVELQNLNRQVLYDTLWIGSPKVEAAAERLTSVNPAVAVQTIAARISSADDVVRLIETHQPEIVVLAADRPAFGIDRFASEGAFRARVPYITGSVTGEAGDVWAKVPGLTGCDECERLWLRDESPDEFEVLEYCERNDLNPATTAIGFGAQIVAGLIGYDIARFLLGEEMAAAGRLLSIDFTRSTISQTDRPRHPHCPVCGSL
jgi:molybdopterin-synthase adenylyltransferase